MMIKFHVTFRKGGAKGCYCNLAQPFPKVVIVIVILNKCFFIVKFRMGLHVLFCHSFLISTLISRFHTHFSFPHPFLVFPSTEHSGNILGWQGLCEPSHPGARDNGTVYGAKRMIECEMVHHLLTPCSLNLSTDASVADFFLETILPHVLSNKSFLVKHPVVLYALQFHTSSLVPINLS